MSAAQCDTNGQKDSQKKKRRGRGNHTQENFAELVSCPKCGVKTRVDTPSVGLVTCDENECDVRAFVLSSTEESKYG